MKEPCALRVALPIVHYQSITVDHSPVVHGDMVGHDDVTLVKLLALQPPTDDQQHRQT